jgi:hypothetical protein
MRAADVMPDVQMAVVRGPISFDDYEPRDVPGYPSNIAKVFGKSESETDSLLMAVDDLSDDHHFNVVRTPVPNDEASLGDPAEMPKKFRVTVSPA